MSRKLFPREVILYDSDPTITVSVAGSAESVAAAFFEELVKRFSVAETEEAFRTVLKGQKPRNAGRRKETDSIALEAGLLREYRQEFDRLVAEGKSSDKARAKAMTCVAEKFSNGPAAIVGLSDASVVRRRLSRLVTGK